MDERDRQEEFTGFIAEDFDVFSVPGLDARMDVLKRVLRPKLQQLGELYAPVLEAELGLPMYVHVAKHARRTVNPPKDSWVAFSADKRGYKQHPHFQIGVWPTHVFAVFGLIYESSQRALYSHNLQTHAADVLARLPDDYAWIPNHMEPDSVASAELDEAGLTALAEQLVERRQGDLLVGKIFTREAVLATPVSAFIEDVSSVFRTLCPLYKMAQTEIPVTF
ncbi:DUF1054 domain-containing protein [Alicyclobacillus sp. SP_1]|uniref:DUF1054 domain-containing protein n=1 Tax=Alicyclobacillus sp. SP_1 TaxID=2942475 RepID=UPI002157A134|nr:DUF1054 domain-containing protein [Alicyclobacillus sp. SP_1]